MHWGEYNWEETFLNFATSIDNSPFLLCKGDLDITALCSTPGAQVSISWYLKLIVEIQAFVFLSLPFQTIKQVNWTLASLKARISCGPWKLLHSTNSIWILFGKILFEESSLHAIGREVERSERKPIIYGQSIKDCCPYKQQDRRQSAHPSLPRIPFE